jgi:hypothetical protein
MRRERRAVLHVRAAEAVGCSGQVGVSPVEDGEVLERAWPDVAQIVGTLALKQRDAAVEILSSKQGARSAPWAPASRTAPRSPCSQGHQRPAARSGLAAQAQRPRPVRRPPSSFSRSPVLRANGAATRIPIVSKERNSPSATVARSSAGPTVERRRLLPASGVLQRSLASAKADVTVADVDAKRRTTPSARSEAAGRQRRFVHTDVGSGGADPARPM